MVNLEGTVNFKNGKWGRCNLVKTLLANFKIFLPLVTFKSAHPDCIVRSNRKELAPLYADTQGAQIELNLNWLGIILKKGAYFNKKRMLNRHVPMGP